MSREFRLGGAPHIPAASSVQTVMLKVLLALVPGIVVSCLLLGPGVLVQIILAMAFALLIEAAMLWLRGKPLRPFLTDFSAPLTAVLFALCLPPWAPWWVAAIGMLAAIVLAKHLYGGLGYNVFNPAMVGYAVVLLAFTRELSQWPAIGGDGVLAASLQAIFGGAPPYDALAQATPLDSLRNQLGQGRTVAELRGTVYGSFGGRDVEWISLAWLAGGLFLLRARIISWQVPVGLIAGVVAVSFPLWIFDNGSNASPLFHLFSGATILGAFFIATDPVSGATTPRGRLLFGAGVGMMLILVRKFGAYPDGLVFGVLLMNAAAPLLDRWTRPRVFGQ